MYKAFVRWLHAVASVANRPTAGVVSLKGSGRSVRDWIILLSSRLAGSFGASVDGEGKRRSRLLHWDTRFSWT